MPTPRCQPVPRSSQPRLADLDFRFFWVAGCSAAAVSGCAALQLRFDAVSVCAHPSATGVQCAAADSNFWQWRVSRDLNCRDRSVRVVTAASDLGYRRGSPGGPFAEA